MPSPSPSDKSTRVRRALAEDCQRSDRLVAKCCGCCPSLVGGIRRIMESAGAVAHRRGKVAGETATAIRIRRLLAAKWEDTDVALARSFRCSKELLRRTRKMMEAEGVIPTWRGGCNGDKTKKLRAALLRDWERTNASVASECGTTERMASVVRERMETGSEIPRWRGHENGERGYTYFARSRLLGLIKIGKTIHPANREALLNSQSADLVDMVGCIRGAGVECDLHRRLRRHRHHNEWYNPTPEVEKAIAECIERSGR